MRQPPLVIRTELRGFQPGRVFVDDLGQPRAAFTFNRFGFCVLLVVQVLPFRALHVTRSTRIHRHSYPQP